MFILQFNRAVRNKWIWGTFAVLVSALFAFDCDGRSSQVTKQADSVGTLDGVEVSSQLLEQIKFEVRGLGLNNVQMDDDAVTEEAWKIASLLQIAEKNGITATDNEVKNTIQRMFGPQAGAAEIRMWLARNRISEKAFTEYFRHRATCDKVEAFVAAGSFVSPAELQRAQSDYNAEFTVKITEFADKSAKRDATEEELKKYYDDNTNSLALPDLATVRYVAYSLKDKAAAAKIEVSEADIKDAFDAAVAADDPRFVSFVTNSTVDAVTHETNTVTEAKIKELDDAIKALVKVDVQLQRYPTVCEEAIKAVIFSDDSFVAKESMIEKLAAKDNLKVRTSKPFARDGYTEKKGFWVKSTAFAPGADSLAADAFALEYDPKEITNDFRYACVQGKDALYVIERASLTPAHVASFAEAKDAIKADAAAEVRANEFKKSVEAKIAKGFDEKALVAAGATVGTNITLSAQTAAGSSVENAGQIIRAVRKLQKGGVSEVISVGTDKSIVVSVIDRKDTNDVSDNVMLRDSLAMRNAYELVNDWKKWNLKRMKSTKVEETK